MLSRQERIKKIKQLKRTRSRKQQKNIDTGNIVVEINRCYDYDIPKMVISSNKNALANVGDD